MVAIPYATDPYPHAVPANNLCGAEIEPGRRFNRTVMRSKAQRRV